MNREQLEHVIRASGDVLKEDEVIIVGSQAILGSSPNGLPRDVTLSTEADVMALSDPDGEKALLINGTIGEFTVFDTTYGYYAEGVEEPPCRFPEDWKERLVPVSTPATNGVTGLCAEPHDLAVAKLLAGRDKDLKYVRALLTSGRRTDDNRPCFLHLKGPQRLPRTIERCRQPQCQVGYDRERRSRNHSPT